jgi:hypothetical protein
MEEKEGIKASQKLMYLYEYVNNVQFQSYQPDFTTVWLDVTDQITLIFTHITPRNRTAWCNSLIFEPLVENCRSGYLVLLQSTGTRFILCL